MASRRHPAISLAELRRFSGRSCTPARDRMELGAPCTSSPSGCRSIFAPSPLAETGPELALRALTAGAFVVAAHPQWYTMTDRDVAALGPIHAIEIFNASCADDNDSADSAYMLDMLLARGQRLTACATDDAHFVPNTHDRTAAGSWSAARRTTPKPARRAQGGGLLLQQWTGDL